jgi:nicotinamidase-related amidase
MSDPTERTTALVVIDVQNAVMEGAWQAEEVVARIATLTERARAVGVPVIYVQHEADGRMERGSEGWQIVEAIAPHEGEVVVAKRYADAFADTTLQETLRGLGVRHVVICGAQSDACVRTTTQRALAEGYDMTLVEDCHTTGDAAFDLADGEKVEISGKQIVAHTNLYIWCLTYPDVTATIAPHDKVELAA